ncbi:MAG TPA: DUF4136 domain-containing protein [Candidatus Acidoferrum sp.]|nr:DUF4136 domain-containing protein [Candidatus Acidoferrum sp.]
MCIQVRNLILAAVLTLTLAFLPAPARAKSNVDLNPNLDFTQYKTFAFIDGVEHLAMMQLNPHQLRDTIHDSVSRALTQRGLKEVRRDQNPNLVVRYLAESNAQLNYTGGDNWGGYDKFTGDWWSTAFTLWYTSTTRNGSLMIDLIDTRRRDLAWRLFLQQQILNVDKLPQKIDKEISKGFESFPPTEKEKQEVRNEHAKQAAKSQKPQGQ